VWELFDSEKTKVYIEPFAGSGAVLFSRPFVHGYEVINDKDINLLNLYRAIKYKPEELVFYLHNLKSAIDASSYKLYIKNNPLQLDEFAKDPEFCSPKMAGYFCLWLSASLGDINHVQRPETVISLTNKGAFTVPMWKKKEALTAWIFALRKRLDKVELLCTDWKKCLTDAHTLRSGALYADTVASVFLDPPYDKYEFMYKHNKKTISSEVRDWCKDVAKHDLIRVILCGYENEHDELLDYGYVKYAGKSANTNSKGRGTKNSKSPSSKEFLWASASCRHKEDLTLF
jgi:site-specific DNA-adenine methylase